MDGEHKTMPLRGIILSSLVIACVLLTIVVNVYMHNQTVYTQFFYVPVLLAALWYHRKALYLAVFLGLLHMAANYFATGGFDFSTLIRASMFIFVGLMAGTIAGEKDRLNRKLNRANVELANVIEFYPDPTLVVDGAGKVVAWNRAMELMTGVKAKDMLGKGDMEYAIPFYSRRMPVLIDLVGMPQDEIMARYPEVSIAGNRLESVVTTARVQGNDAPVLHATASKLYDADGAVIGAIESVRDITAQKRMEVELGRKLGEVESQRDELEQQEEELQKQNEELLHVFNLLKASEKKYRQLVELAQEGIWAIDAGAVTTFVNPRMAQMLGYAPQEMIGKHLHAFMDERGAQLAAQYLGRRKGGVTEQHDFEFVKKDGSRIYTILEASPLWDEQGGYAGALAVVTDITMRRKSEEALRYKNKELEIIGNIASIINRSSVMEEFLEGTLAGSLELLEMDSGAIYLNDPADRSRMLLRASLSRTEAGLGVEPMKAIPADPALNSERVFYSPDSRTVLYDRVFKGGTARIIVPILLKGFAIGLMAFYSREAPSGNVVEANDLLSIASQLGIAIDNQNLMRTLRATSNYMAEIINESPDAIITADAKGNIISANKRAAQLLKYDMIELSGMNLRQLMPGGEDAAPAGNRSYVRDFLQKDGMAITLNISTSSLESGDVPGGCIITLKDLSEIVGLKIAPAAEKPSQDAPKQTLEKGLIYLFDRGNDGNCMDVFADQVKHNVQGLCITRHNPGKIRVDHGLEKTPIVWLNGSDLPTGEHCIKPDNLTGLGATINKFIAEANDGMVLLDGIEYLISRNGFESVLKFMHLLNDRVMSSRCRIVLCIDPLTLEQRQYHLLLTEMRRFSRDAGA